MTVTCRDQQQRGRHQHQADGDDDFVPNRATSFALSGAATMSAAATGMSAAPALSAEYPSTNCRYWLTKNSEPNIAKNTSVTATDAAVNRGFGEERTSSIGWSVMRSQRTNAVSSTSADDERAR